MSAARPLPGGARPDLSVLREDLQSIQPYVVPAPHTGIKLDAMENPFALPAELQDTLAQRLARVALNRYPPANPQAFKARLAAAMGVPDTAALMLGNGSDELIHLVIQACAKPGATVLSPWPSFAMYELSARFDGCRFAPVPLQPDFRLDTPALLAAIADHRPAVVFLSYPNNPTGNLFARDDVAAVLRAAPGLVVIDEAYLPFAQDTWMPQIADWPNLLVLRTLSKLGLAGIRLGYMAGAPEWIREIDKLRPPYNVNVLTLACADFLLDHLPVLNAQATELRSERGRLSAALAAQRGVTAFESAANFLLFRVAQPDAVFAGLKERGILIKNVSKMHLLTGCLRVTVGTPAENDAFLQALKAALDESR